MNNKRGITLIALIITIIVMLILVGVTINVALNGGIFGKAKDATQKTEKEAIYEQIVDKMEITNAGTIDVKATFDKVVEEFGADKVTNINPSTVDENTTKVTFTIAGKTGTYDYKISTKSIEKNDKVYSFTIGELLNLNYEIGSDSSLVVSYEEFSKLLGIESMEEIKSEYYFNMGGSSTIDYNSSDEEIIESSYSFYLGNNVITGKYIIFFYDFEGRILINIGDKDSFGENGRELIKQQSDVDAFKSDTENITITLEKKDRMEQLIKQMQG